MHRYVQYAGSSVTDIQYLHRDHPGSVDATSNATGGRLSTLFRDSRGVCSSFQLW